MFRLPLMATVLCLAASAVGCVKTPAEFLDSAAHTDLSTKTKDTGKIIAAAAADATASSSSACLNLVNGQAIGTTTLPAVVLIQLYDGASPIQYCSGTFVSDRALLTAGHCVDSSATGNVQLMPVPASGDFHDALGQPGIPAVQSFNLGYTYEQSQEDADNDVALNDVAIVLFPPGTAPAVMPLASHLPSVGTTVTMVGYGVSTYSNQAEDTSTGMIKRTGTNQIIESPDYLPGQDSTILSIGGDTASSGATMGSFGDSGSPLVFNGGIAGTYRSSPYATTSTGDILYFGQYIATSSATTQQLIAAANLAGAGIADVKATPSGCN